MKFTTKRLSELAGAGHIGPETAVAGVTYDSRKVAAGSLYVAVRGARADGRSFIPQAIANGATAVLIEEDGWRDHIVPGATYVVAKDPVAALSRFASMEILSNRNFTGIAVTGSCGKTTTKEMIASILSVRHRVRKTPGNLNSDYGLPISLLGMEEGDEYGVFEMGVDGVGQMDRLTRTFPPEIACITNIGITHLEDFGSRDAIAREKGKILLPQTRGFALGGGDYNPYFKSIGDLTEVADPFSEAEFLGLDGIRLKLGRERFVMPTVGMHNIQDACLAVAVARECGASDHEIAIGLSELEPLFGRSRVVKEGGLTVIEDCYNATLDSVSDAIRTVDAVRWKGSKHIVLGDMVGLGSASREAHRQVGRALAGTRCPHIYLYGERMEDAFRELVDSGAAGRAFHTPDFETLRKEVASEASLGDLMLIKGSRAMAMERLFDTLREVGRSA